MLTILLISFAAMCQGLVVVDVPGETMIREVETENGPVQLVVGRKKGRAVTFDVPKSFEIFSKPFAVSKDKEEGSRVGRDFKIDTDNIPVIDGIRMPDDPSDKQVYRNARIIKNVLIPNEKVIQSEEIKHEPKELDESRKLSARQARILTGAEDGETEIEKKVGKQSSQTSRQNPNAGQSPTYYHFYDPSRIGVLSNQNLQQVGAPSNEKVVTYSFNAGLSGVQNRPNKDVVYGSGFATIPQHPSSQTRNVKRKAQYANIPASSFQPSKGVTGFMPSGPYSNGLVQGYPANSFSERNIETESGFKFPEASANNHNQYNPVSSNTNIQQQYYQHGVNLPQYESQPEIGDQIQHYPQQVSSYQNLQAYPAQNAYQNQLGQHNQQSFNQQNGPPTPQKTLGSYNPLIAGSSVVPVDASNFIIEEATFQSHPGAPVFNIPVPRPTQHLNRKQFQVQQPEYDPYQQYYEYPRYEYADNRPLLEKMMDPLRRVGHRVRQIASNAGNRFRIPERIDKIASGTVDADVIPIFAGAAAVATLGALGAYAASRFSSLDGLTLPNGGKRSSRFTVPDILSQLADKLNDEDPSIVSKLTADTKWLESSCARKIFCTLVTDSFKEEEQKFSAGRSAKPNFAQEMLYLEKQMEVLLESAGSSGAEATTLRNGANEVMRAVKNKDCSEMSCARNDNKEKFSLKVAK